MTFPLPHSHTNRHSSTCLLYEWHVYKSVTRALNTPIAVDRCNVCPQCTLQQSEKGKVFKSNDLPYLTRQRHIHHGQLDKRNLGNTCPGSGAWQATSTYNSLTLVKVVTPDTRQHSSTLEEGLTNPSLSSCQDYYPKHQKNFLNTGQFISSLDNLFRPQAELELGGLMYCPGPLKYMWHPTWNLETRVNPPRQPCYRSTDAWPLVARLPDK